MRVYVHTNQVDMEVGRRGGELNPSGRGGVGNRPAARRNESKAVPQCRATAPTPAEGYGPARLPPLGTGAM